MNRDDKQPETVNDEVVMAFRIPPSKLKLNEKQFTKRSREKKSKKEEARRSKLVDVALNRAAVKWST